jgi:hypothetical protein
MHTVAQPYFAPITVGKDGHAIVNEAVSSQSELWAFDLSMWRDV